MDAELIAVDDQTLRACVPYWWSDMMIARWANQTDMRMVMLGGLWQVQRREACDCLGQAHVVLAAWG